MRESRDVVDSSRLTMHFAMVMTFEQQAHVHVCPVFTVDHVCTLHKFIQGMCLLIGVIAAYIIHVCLSDRRYPGKVGCCLQPEIDGLRIISNTTSEFMHRVTSMSEYGAFVKWLLQL